MNSQRGKTPSLYPGIVNQQRSANGQNMSDLVRQYCCKQYCHNHILIQEEKILIIKRTKGKQGLFKYIRQNIKHHRAKEIHFANALSILFFCPKKYTLFIIVPPYFVCETLSLSLSQKKQQPFLVGWALKSGSFLSLPLS